MRRTREPAAPRGDALLTKRARVVARDGAAGLLSRAARAVVPYGIAIFWVAAALALKLAVDPLRERSGVQLLLLEGPFLIFFVSVVLSAWYGGLWPGLFATALSTLAIDYFLLPPPHSFSLPPGPDQIRLTLFACEASVLSALVGSLHRAVWRAEQVTREREEALVAAEAAHARAQEAEVRTAQARREAEEARVRAEAAAERRRRVQAITDAAIAELSLMDLLHAILVRVQRALGSDTAVILLRDPGTDTLQVRAALGVENEGQVQVRIPVGQGFAGRVAAERQAVLVDPVDYAEVVSPYIAAQGLRALLGVPLLVGDRVIGVLQAGSRSSGKLEQDDADLLQLAGDRVALAIERARVYDAEQQAHAEAAFIAEVTGGLTASLDYEQLLASLARLVVPRLADCCLVSVFEESARVRRAFTCADSAKEGVLREVLAHYRPEPGLPEAATTALSSGESLLYPDIPEGFFDGVGNEEGERLSRALGYTSAMIVPLRARGQTLGVMTLLAGESGRRFGQAELALAKDIGRRAALAVENARLYRDAQAAWAEAERANRTKDEFIAFVSHELRAPLGAILLWAQMIRSGKLDAEKTRQALETIERSARLQARLIEDLLDISRIEAGKLTLDTTDVELGPVITAAVAVARPAAEAKRIRLDVHGDLSGVAVRGDPARLEQVVGNLLANAIKFTPEEGRVGVELERGKAGVTIGVRDTGVGIAPDLLPHIFKRFVQAAGAERQQGLGLGLAIVRHLVELHGGTVEAESAGKGRGATFTLRLPVLH